jgi:hypothetical protein
MVKDGFPRPVVWLLVALFVAAVFVTAYWWWAVIRDVWIGGLTLVAGRFDTPEQLRITAAVLASVAVPAGLLWAHHKRAESYGAPWELFFGIVFALTSILAAVTLVPAHFS